ncbi:MAG: hypothetical protein ONB44_17595 [candidate division KSB1 bacterium]|nr:hypothetical protein [candidate division KSB1 bacterium]MDZ7303941.1 hypothetical protein [candidate division KSB1 bacterium]MDZ7313102.1 hypothetical protein [candidate division KSB1 bacterium]
MDELLQDIAAEKERIESTLQALEKVLRRKRRTFVELAAIATCLHNSYSGMENLLKRVLKHLKVSLPDSTTSHKDLLALAVEQEIISQELLESLDEYRAFRHFFVHGYGILLQEAPLQPLAQSLPAVWNRFESELDAFITSRKNP